MAGSLIESGESALLKLAAIYAPISFVHRASFPAEFLRTVNLRHFSAKKGSG